jgi:hypothetical protein
MKLTQEELKQSTTPLSNNDRVKLSRESYIYNQPFTHSSDVKATQSLMKQVISQFRLGMDLTSLTCPAFVLRPKSFLEMSADVACPTVDLLNAQNANTPVERMLLITKWLLTSMTVSPGDRIAGMKPYNPVLSEQFLCCWDHGDSLTRFYSEQVSHHPPISAFHMINNLYQFSLSASVQLKMTFLGNAVDTVFHGKYILNLERLGEKYDIVLPAIMTKGLFFGKCHVEHSKSLIVTCDNHNITLKLDAKSGNTVEGHIFEEKIGSRKKSKLYDISGNIFTGVYIAKHSKPKSEKQLFLNPGTVIKPRKIVKEVYDQSPMESRRFWHNVSFSLHNHNLEAATKFKHEIEEQERAKRRQRERDGLAQIPTPNLFHQVEDQNGMPSHQFKRGQELTTVALDDNLD